MDKDRLKCLRVGWALLRHRIVGGDVIRACKGRPIGGIVETSPMDPG